MGRQHQEELLVVTEYVWIEEISRAWGYLNWSRPDPGCRSIAQEEYLKKLTHSETLHYAVFFVPQTSLSLVWLFRHLHWFFNCVLKPSFTCVPNRKYSFVYFNRNVSVSGLN
jgi:hypothetical protein